MNLQTALYYCCGEENNAGSENQKNSSQSTCLNTGLPIFTFIIGHYNLIVRSCHIFLSIVNNFNSNYQRLLFVDTHISFIIGLYNPSVRITSQLLTPLMSCALIFIHEWLDLQFKVDSERQIFEKLFHGNFIFLRVFAKNLLRGSRRRNISTISF